MSQNNRLCIWKNAVIGDEENLKAGNPIRTFDLSNPNLPCVSCSGYQTSCKCYAPMDTNAKNQRDSSNSKLEKVTA